MFFNLKTIAQSTTAVIDSPIERRTNSDPEKLVEFEIVSDLVEPVCPTLPSITTLSASLRIIIGEFAFPVIVNAPFVYMLQEVMLVFVRTAESGSA